MDNEAREAEIKRLNETVSEINKRLTKVRIQLDGKKEGIIELRKQMWEEVPHLIYDWDDAIQMVSYGSGIKRGEEAYIRQVKEWQLLEKLVDSPYFGRIDFIEDNSQEADEIYIGIGSFYDNETFKFYVYDWRSPVSSVFYDYGIGTASYKSPDGIVSGTVTLKRQYKIENGTFEYMFDSDMTVNDDLLGKVLSAVANPDAEQRLKVIINSIQQEQNKIIRCAGKTNLAVFGPAGSGKTSVGLHRLAYLLYNMRDSLISKNILVISNNYIFNSYISGILPNLGEDDILRFVLDDIIRSHIPSGFKLYGYFEQAEYYQLNEKEIRNAKDIRLKGIGIKYSLDFLQYIEEFFARFIFELCDIIYMENSPRSALICTKEELERDLNITHKKLSFKSKVNRLDVYVNGKINDYFVLNKEKLITEIINYTDGLVNDSDAYVTYKNLHEETRLSAKRKLRKAGGLYEINLYKRLFGEYINKKQENIEIYNYTVSHLDEGILLFEDLLALVCVKIQMGNIKNENRIKQVLIDEAQDFNILQHYIIKNLFREAQFTILADVNQGVFGEINIGNEEDLVELYNAQRMTLNKSYRSTTQINSLTSKLIGADYDYFKRNGSEPELIISNEIEQAVSETIIKHRLDEKPLSCIITQTVKQTEALYNFLRSKFDIVKAENTEYSLNMTGRLLIMPVILAKGLEFDNVIVIDFSEIKNEEAASEKGANKLLYLMCSRALHNLYIIASEKRGSFWAGLLN